MCGPCAAWAAARPDTGGSVRFGRGPEVVRPFGRSPEPGPASCGSVLLPAHLLFLENQNAESSIDPSRRSWIDRSLRLAFDASSHE